MPDGSPLEQRLLALFLEELDDNVGVLNRGLLALERNAAQPPPPALVAELFRAAHSLKGAAHSASVPSAVAISDRLEERLVALRDGTAELTPAMLRDLFGDVDALAAESRRLRGAGEPTVEPSDNAAFEASSRDALVGAATVRVAPQKLDALLDRSAELRVSTQRLRALAAAVAVGRDRAASTAGERVWHPNHTAAIPSALSDAAAASGGHTSDQAWSDLNAELEQLSRELSTAARTLSQETDRVLEATHELRLQRFEEVCEGLDRTVRDLASATGKRAAFTLDGGDLEIDRGVATALREPILHLLRNAVDHGIEPADQRVRARKAEAGMIRVAAAIREGNVELSVADDGGGVDLAALRVAAETQQRTVPDNDIELAFAAGLSTASTVSDVSGRGVGLDAVRSRIESLGGSVEIETNPGAGTRVLLRLPRTFSTLRALIVSADGEAIALPLTAVRRLVRLEDSDIREAAGRPYAVLDGEPIPLIPLSAALAFNPPITASDTATINGVVVATGAGQAVAIVDGLIDEAEILLKSLPPRAANLPGVLGATVLPDGRPALVVSPSVAIRLGVASQAPVQARARHEEPQARRVLLAEDTLTTRVLEQSILEGAGYQVTVASDGAQAWRLLHDHPVDIVVSDVDMPEMDGVELCRAIKTSARFRGIPVVLVTALASDDDRQRGLDAGANAYIVKSAFDQRALLDTLEQLL